MKLKLQEIRPGIRSLPKVRKKDLLVLISKKGNPFLYVGGDGFQPFTDYELKISKKVAEVLIASGIEISFSQTI